MSTSSSVALETVPAWLDRHAQRRAAGIPTVSVLTGPVGLGSRCWRRWAAARDQSTVQLSTVDVEAAVSAWTTALAGQRDLTRAALAFLAARLGRPVADLQASLAARTLHDFERFWESLPRAWDDTDVAVVCRRLVERHVLGEPGEPQQLAGLLAAVLGTGGGARRRLPAALAALVPPEALPTLLLVPPPAPADVAAWLAAAARLLTALVTSTPGLPAALAVERQALEYHLRGAPESHARALLREGMLPVACLDEAAVGRRLEELGLSGEELAGPARRLAADGASEELVRAFGEAVQRLREPPAEDVADDRARSAAERFLFEWLESLSETTGQFEVNGTLDFRFGSVDAEIDLLARGLRLAIEVDGYYHFRDPAAYRRDRRKDWELQRRGYVVLRFLAEDVAARVEEMLDTIRDAVEHCRHQRHSGRTTKP